jgi:hypothetical protein
VPAEVASTRNTQETKCENVLRAEKSITIENQEIDEPEQINILIRFVNEKEMKIQAKPNDTILFLKK